MDSPATGQNPSPPSRAFHGVPSRKQNSPPLEPLDEASPVGRGNGPDVFEWHQRLPAAQLQYCFDVLGLDVDCPAVGRRNDHGAAAIERHLAAVSALKAIADLPGRYCEVGANAPCTAEWCTEYGLPPPRHSVSPVLPGFPHDGRKLADARARELPVCGCWAQDCPHLTHADNLLFVHSEYYFGPLELAELLRRTRGHAVSVRHDFPDAAGSLCAGGLTYYVDPDGQVVCHAKGERHSYRHDPGWWRLRTHIPISPHYHLVWHEHERFGDTAVVVWRLVDGPCPDLWPVSDLPFEAASQAAGINTCSQLDVAIERRVVNPRFDVHILPFTSVFSVAGMFVFPSGPQTVVCVPRGLIGSLKTLAVAKPRTPALYRDLTSRAKRTLSQLDVPDDIAALACSVAASAALVAVEPEIASLGRAVALNRHLFDLHARVLEFQPLRVVPWWATSVVAPIAGSALAVVGHPVLAAGAAVVGTAAWANSLYQNSHLWNEAKNWRDRRLLGEATHVNDVAYFDGAQLYPGLFKPKTPPGRPIDGSVTVLRAPHPRVDKAEDRLVLGHVGLAFSTVTPSAIARTEDAAVNAIESRLLAKYPAPQPGSWAVLHGRLRDPNRPLSGLALKCEPIPDDYFQVWVAGFPQAVADTLRKAKESLAETPFCHNDCRLSMIVKSEKTGWVEFDSVTPNDARAVLSPSPRFNAFVGPYAKWYTAGMIKLRAAEVDSVVFWAVACSAETLGAWDDFWTAHFSRPGKPAKKVIGDHRRLDGHEQDESDEFTTDLYTQAGMPARITDALSRLSIPRGRVQGHDHVKFKGKRRRQISGRPDTTARNCANVEAAMDYSLGPPSPQTYVLAVKGDDVYAIGFYDFVPEPSVIAAKHAELGFDFDCRVTTHDYDVEFASMVPYPSADGTVFGPKIGRCLGRGGWSVKAETSDPHGMAVSMEASVSHIPFLRQFYALHRRLCRPAGPYREWHILANEPHLSCPETYRFVEERYGLTAADEAAFAAKLATIRSLPAVIEWPRINEVVRRDD